MGRGFGGLLFQRTREADQVVSNIQHCLETDVRLSQGAEAKRQADKTKAIIRAVTPGQALLPYDADVVLGGGWIDHPDRQSASLPMKQETLIRKL